MAKCKVRLKRGKKDGRLGKAGGKKGARTMSCSGEAILGSLTIAGIAEPIPFGVDPNTKDPKSTRQSSMFVYEKHRRMATVLSGSSSSGSEETEQATEPIISVDVTMEGAPKAAKLMVTIRHSTEVEKRRSSARAALREAEGSDDYQQLHGQIVKARQSGVDTSDIQRAQTVLKTLKPDTLAKEEITELMVWDKVTRYELPVEVDRCDASAACSCHEAKAVGEELEFSTDALEQALAGVRKEGQTAEELGKRLFECIVDAAMVFPEGSVWKAGGKFILSHPDR